MLQKLKEIPDKYINTCVTSPPYWGLRDYGVAGQIGLEKTPEEYVNKIVQVFREVRRVLRDDGTLWLNLGDSYAASGADRTAEQIAGKSCKLTGIKSALAAGKQQNKVVGKLKPKDLVGIPWMVAFALRADGWYFRQDIIWHKPNPMPESVKDRCTKAHEYIFLLSKSQKYYYDQEAIREPDNPDGRKQTIRKQTDRYNNNLLNTFQDNEHQRWTGTRNKRSVWTVSTKPFPGSHFATFPPDLIEPCILAGSPKDGIVLDPFFGAGTTGIVSLKNGRYYIGIELNPEYAEMAENRIKYGTVDSEEIKANILQHNLF